MPTTLGKYQLGMTLGSGVSCKVKLAKDQTGTRYAIKVLHNDEAFLELIKAEVKTLRQLQHPYIVNLIEEGNGVMSNPKKGNKTVDYLVLEYVNGGDLFDFIANSGRFQEDVARYYFHQFMDALSYMHNNNCAHRDLKPENIMLDSEFNLKIADFGFAAPAQGRDGSGMLHTQLGTASYMAPEIHLGKPYTGPGVDLFAAAIILFMMMAQRPPFNQPNPQDPHYRLLAADRADLFWKAHDEADGGESIPSDEFKDLFTKMTRLNPAQRLDMDGVRSHPWFLGKVPSKAAIQMEFQQRKVDVDKEAQAERDEKRNERAQRHGGARRGDVVLGEDEQLMFNEAMETFKQTELTEFEECIPKMTSFFTTASIDQVAGELFLVLKGAFNCAAEMLPFDGKMKFEWSGEKELEKEKAKVTVKFLKVDESKIFVEFNRRQGNQMVFLDNYKKLMKTKEMKVYEDTTLLEKL